jgi:glycosyltransferase involved in cell wall biosynthesis
MNSPAISVIMPTYNHADFVAEAIDSVFSQQGCDFEFLIADDGSSDRTREIVASIHDKRMRFFSNEINRGACFVTNELIQRATGEFVALINSDDYWVDDYKLAYQLQLMRENPALGACFGRARFVGNDGSGIDKALVPQGHVFDQKNRSRGTWLRHFFDRGNCICHPTMLIRKSCYESLGMYDNRLRQLPDFDMWVRLLKRYDIHVSDREMIAFRHLPGESASSPTTDNLRRLLNESYFILQRFFDGVARDVFIDGFGDLLVESNPPDNIHIEIEQSLLYLAKNRWASHIYNLIGLEKLHFMLSSNEHRRILVGRYGIDDRNLHAISAGVGAFDLDDSTGRLSNVKGGALVAEVKRRILWRIPSVMRPALNSILNRF